MKRQIKFRAWDKVNECYSEEPFFRLTLANNGKVYNSENDEWHEPDGRYIIQFFTGLTDKNGKEIYEGDILKGYKEWDGKPVVVKWGEHHGKHSVGMVYGYYMPDTGLEPYHWEIIGNIYENPELLKS